MSALRKISLIGFALCAAWAASPADVRKEIDAGGGHYAYAPCMIKTKGGSYYAFLCQNETAGVVVDSIYRFEGKAAASGDIRWRSPRCVLSPSSKKWESVHTCDPDVRAVKAQIGGQTYDWAMTYLGCDRLDCNNNQIGIAFAKKIDGAWTRYAKNPIVSAPDAAHWGAGQSTSLSTDDGGLEMFYTLGASKEGGLCRARIAFKGGAVAVGEAQKIRGLAANAFVARDAHYYYAVQPREPHTPGTLPPVSRALRILRCPVEENIETAQWEALGDITPDETGFPYNHNGGFLTDERGWLPDSGELVVYFSVSKGGADWLWSYSLYSARFPLK